MKRLIKACFLLPLIFCACKNEIATEPVEDLFGVYESSTFIEPGSRDGGVDIQSSGGYINLILMDNYEFTAELYIPPNVGSNYLKGYSYYKGKWSLEETTVIFITSKFIIDSLTWNKDSGIWESFDVPLRGGPFKIIMTKNDR